MKVAVLGFGSWGCALAMLLTENGHDVTVWSYQQSEIDYALEHKENIMLPGVKLPKSLKYSTDVSCVDGCDAVVFVTPSFSIRNMAKQAAPYIKENTVLISASKGMERETMLRLSQVIEEETCGRNPVVVLSGPSHAEEVSRKIPTAVTAASSDIKDAQFVQNLFMNSVFRVYTADDVIGVEVCATLKNVIALCAGACVGMGYGDNTKAMLITRGLTEIGRLSAAMGGERKTCTGLSGVGDLIVTCTSMHSRNNRFGILIGKGKGIEEARKEIGAVVEGYYAAAIAHNLADKYKISMPIAQTAYSVLYEGKDVNHVMRELMERDRKQEFDV